MTISQNIIEHAKRMYPKGISYKGNLTDKQMQFIQKKCDIDWNTLASGEKRYTIFYKITPEDKIIDNIARLNSETWRDREEVRTEIGKLLVELEKVLEQLTIDKAKMHTLVEENEKLKADNEILAENCLKDLINCHSSVIQQPCDDCISRQAVIAYIKDCDAELMHDSENEFVREDILNMPPVTPTQSWIPVSEGLPKKNMPCLVSVGSFLHLTQIAMCSDLMGTIDHKIFYQGDYGHDTFRDITKCVRAWQPLPKRYEEKRGNENDSN